MTRSGNRVVLFGGTSRERRVSVASAQNVAAQLPGAGLIFWSTEGTLHAVPEQALAHGIATTDARGQATIRFHAAATASALEEQDPILQFAIAADVTDLTGETRSGNTTLPLGRLAIQASLGIQQEMPIDSMAHIPLHFTNLSDQAVAAKGTLRLQRLDAPSGITHHRLWELPDVFTLPEAAFRRDFPGWA